jgi:hypothetical protein
VRRSFCYDLILTNLAGLVPIIRQNAIPLFSEQDLSALVQGQMEKAYIEVAGKDADELLSIPVEDQVEIIVAHFRLNLPTLREDLACSGEPKETTLQVQDYGRQISVPAIAYQITIPFEGDTGLFRHFPATRTLMHPLATLAHRELVMTLVGYNVTADDINQEIDKTTGAIKQFLEWQRPQVEACNIEIRESARRKIEERKDRILQSRRIAAALRYPLRRRDDAPLTYVSSELRRTIAPARKIASQSSAHSFTPEPTIEEAEYQHILKIMGDMALMMERSPRTFAKLDEEEIRDHFLLQLNGHYEGSATGETFNAAGKTDILVREGNRNLFIGECKIWEGSKKFLQGIEQLLSYLTWRDTKSAIIVFSRTRTSRRCLKASRRTSKSILTKSVAPRLRDRLGSGTSSEIPRTTVEK